MTKLRQPLLPFIASALGLLLLLLAGPVECGPKRVKTNYTFQNLTGCTQSTLSDGTVVNNDCTCYHPWVMQSAQGGKDAPIVLDCRHSKPTPASTNSANLPQPKGSEQAPSQPPKTEARNGGKGGR